MSKHILFYENGAPLHSFIISSSGNSFWEYWPQHSYLSLLLNILNAITTKKMGRKKHHNEPQVTIWENNDILEKKKCLKIT